MSYFVVLLLVSFLCAHIHTHTHTHAHLHTHTHTHTTRTHTHTPLSPSLQITLNAMKSENEQIALQGVEFWSTVCDEEADLSIEAIEVLHYTMHNVLEHTFGCVQLIIDFLSCFGMSVSQHLYWNKHIQQYCTLINSRRACARVTVVGLCLCVRYAEVFAL